MTARVTTARAFLVDIPVETVRTDAKQSFLKQETIFVEVRTDDGATGLGYSYTIGTGGTAVLAMLNDYLLPQLVGLDAERVEAVWRQLYDATRATAVGAITSLALAAVDTALWDRRCLVAGLPLSVLAGGARSRGPPPQLRSAPRESRSRSASPPRPRTPSGWQPCGPRSVPIAT